MGILTFHNIDNHNCIQIFNLKIKYRTFSLYPHLKSLINLYIKFRLRFLKRKYRIIPIGNYCLPRVITTLNNLKPRKEDGELTCPFDLAHFDNIDKTIELIDTRFANFYDGLSYNKEKGLWENKELTAVYNHDGQLNKEEFINRYNARINNFYNYASENSTFKFFLLSTFQNVSQSQIQHCLEVLQKVVNPDNFKLIIINQSDKFLACKSPNVSIINQNHNNKKYYIINDMHGGWWGQIRSCNSKMAFQIFSEISLSMLNVICKTCA